MALLPTISGLGTTWWIEIFDDCGTEKLQVIFNDLQLFINNFNNNYSRFDSKSHLSQLNKNRQVEYPSTEFQDLLQFGITLYRDTDKVFNFLIGAQLEAIGYDADYSFTPKDISPIISNPITSLLLTTNLITLTDGLIDMGGYGKGYLIDLIAKHLKEKYALEYFLINGGGDMYATSNFKKPISIYLEHPTIPNTYLVESKLFNEGFAASSTKKRHWKSAGKKFTHIIDSKTGQSNDSDLGVFVKAPEAKLADAWATTMLLSSPEKHLQKLRANNIKVAIFTAENNQLYYYENF